MRTLERRAFSSGLHGDRHSIKRDRGIGGWIKATAGCTLLAGIFVLLLRDSRGERWQSSPGVIQGTRVIPDHAEEWKRGNQLTWRAEYKVAYSALDREYDIWTDSGIRGENEADVQMALPAELPSCRVRYDPRKPEESVAHCP